MKVQLTRESAKQLQKITPVDQKKIYKKLESLPEDYKEGKKLKGELSGLYSMRVWPYRIVYEINSKDEAIVVHLIAHRQGVYK